MPIGKHNGLGPEYPQHPKHKVWLAQRARWMHNGYLGSIMMALKNMETIRKSPTATDRAKQLSCEIAAKLTQLQVEMKTRKSGT